MSVMSGFAPALTAALMVMGAWALYWPLIKRMQVPLRPVGFQAVVGAGMIMSLVSLLLGAGLFGLLLDFVALAAGGFFLFSTMNSRMPERRPKVAAGETILDFSATASDGRSFSLSSLHGDPFILKFFRGHW